MKSKSINKLIREIIFHYSSFDKLSQCYVLSIENVPSFELERLSALFMLSDNYSASEATGPDNPYYFNELLPSLINLLTNDNKEAQEEFISDWKSFVTRYFMKQIKELLELSIDDYNQDLGFVKVA